MLRIAFLPLFTLATALSFVYFGLGGVLLSWVILPLLRAFTPVAARMGRCQDVVGRGLHGFWAFMHYTGVLRFLPPRWAERLPPGPCLIVANHPTLIDVTAAWAAYGRVHTVVQSYMYRNPITWNLLAYTGQIRGPDGSIPEAARILAEMQELLARGGRLVIFPEGSRSPERGLHAFKRGAFQVACRTGAPIVPLLFRMEPPILGKTAPWYRTPRVRPVYTMTAFDPVDPAPWGEDSAALTRAFEAFYRRCIAGEAAETAYAATIGQRG